MVGLRKCLLLSKLRSLRSACGRLRLGRPAAGAQVQPTAYFSPWRERVALACRTIYSSRGERVSTSVVSSSFNILCTSLCSWRSEISSSTLTGLLSMIWSSPLCCCQSPPGMGVAPAVEASSAIIAAADRSGASDGKVGPVMVHPKGVRRATGAASPARLSSSERENQGTLLPMRRWTGAPGTGDPTGRSARCGNFSFFSDQSTGV